MRAGCYSYYDMYFVPWWHKVESEDAVMKSSTMSDVSVFLEYLTVFKKIGNSSIKQRELEKYLIEIFPDKKFQDGCISVLSPFIEKSEEQICRINMDVLRETLSDFFVEFLPGLLSRSAIYEYVTANFRDYVFVSRSEVENENNQAYKFLYEKLCKKYDELLESFYGQKYELDNAHKELALQNMEIKNLKENSGNMKNTTMDIAAFIKDFVGKDVVIQNVVVRDSSGKEIICRSDLKKGEGRFDIAEKPAVYSFKRPSWFTPLQKELDKKNVSKKNVENTEPLLSKKLLFWEKMKKDKSKIGIKAEKVDKIRRENIIKLLEAEISNEEKYIKYMLLTPGMSREYMKTINGAAELGLSANVVIKLLEQPAECFNKEMFEAYVSQVHKATEYNLKQELANELICGEWYITSDINGSSQRYQLVPIEMILEVKERLEHICKVFEEYEKITSSSALCHDGTKGYETCSKKIETEMTEYDDGDILEPPDFIIDPTEFFLEHQEEVEEDEMNILFARQIEKEFERKSMDEVF